MANVSKFKINNNEYVIKDSLAQENISTIIDANQNLNDRLEKIENEDFKVISTSLNDLNNRINTLENGDFGEDNIIESITVNDTQIIPDANKNINISIKENVKPDWNAASGSDAEILNKPNIVIENGGNNNSIIKFSPFTLSIDAGSSNELLLQGSAIDINGLTFTDGGDVLDGNGESILLKTLDCYSSEYEITSEIDDNTLSNDVYKVNFYEVETDPASGEMIGEHISKGLLIHNDNNQYVIKDNEIKYRIYENGTWSEWQSGVQKPDWNAASGSDAEILNKPDLSNFITSIKTVNNESIVGTGNIVVPGLPTVTSADNGKILMVVNVQWQLVSPSVLYSGSGIPNNANGNNGDLYMQTN